MEWKTAPENLNAGFFPQKTTEWICWHAEQMDMPVWWQEL